jgi:hypothetical protein
MRIPIRSAVRFPEEIAMRSLWSGLALRSALALFLVHVAATASAQTPLGSAWTYQGRLAQSGSPASGSIPMVFTLWDAASAGNQVGPTLTFNGVGGNPPPVSVSNGVFTVSLDFGAGVFGPSARWLEITVNGVALAPRQAVDSTPAAAFSMAPWATLGSNLSYTGGNVGIGTTQPNTALEVSRATGDTEIGILGGDSGRRWTLQSSAGGEGALSGTFQIIDRTAGAARMLIDPMGNVGIGTSAPTSKLSVAGGGSFTGDLGIGGHARVLGDATVYQDLVVLKNLGVNTLGIPQSRVHVVGDVRVDSGALQFGSITDNSDPMYIVRQNNSPDYSQLVINLGDNPGSDAPPGDDLIIRAGTVTQFIFRSNGTAAKTGAPLWATISDARAKHDIEPLNGVLDRLMALKGHTFFYNEPNIPGARPGRCIGFVAQEVEPVFPDWVSTDSSGLKTLQVAGFEALAVEALRDLRAEKDAQIAAARAANAANDKKLEELRHENAALHARLDSLEGALRELTARMAAEHRTQKSP